MLHEQGDNVFWGDSQKRLKCLARTPLTRCKYYYYSYSYYSYYYYCFGRETISSHVSTTATFKLDAGWYFYRRRDDRIADHLDCCIPVLDDYLFYVCIINIIIIIINTNI
ncbi:hypothetical protein T4E_7116 [Trichinella pseudospiralis]|uniref:Uncharacterized protein n=1 Tax=Trichinella pseudospiralis TaxID=6337 RepID=A0A0V0YCP6_TRIPS|nr:hypothetical protein T4E_7116 [Trichinella pseudospiralis]